MLVQVGNILIHEARAHGYKASCKILDFSVKAFAFYGCRSVVLKGHQL